MGKSSLEGSPVCQIGGVFSRKNSFFVCFSDHFFKNPHPLLNRVGLENKAGFVFRYTFELYKAPSGIVPGPSCLRQHQGLSPSHCESLGLASLCATMEPGFHECADMPSLSRLQVLAALEQTETLPVLIDLVNAHLGEVRLEWGDSLDVTRQCAHVWFSCAFPLSGPEAAWTLEATRALARHVLAPPLGADGSPGFSMLHWSIEAALAENPDREKWTSRMVELIPWSAGAVASRSRVLYPDVDSIEAMARGEAFGLHHTVEEGSVVEKIKALRQSLTHEDLPDLLEKADRLGFASVSCGPAGGMGAMAANLHVIEEGMEEWAGALGVDAGKIGLGVHLAANVSAKTDHGFASYHAHWRQMNFGPCPGAIAHEWTHAYEDWLSRSIETTPVNEMLYEAFERIVPDASLVARHELAMEGKMREAIGFLMEDFCDEKASEPLRVFFREHGHAPAWLTTPILEWLESDLLDQAVARNVVDLLKANRDPSKGSLNAAVVRMHVDDIRPLVRVWQENRAAQGTCVFTRFSRWVDQSGLLPSGKDNYWSSMSERVARATEGVWSGRVSPVVALVPEDDSPVAQAYPRGQEKEQIRAIMENWYDHLARLYPARPLLDFNLAPRLKSRRSGISPGPDEKGCGVSAP
jgi:hypothetical protein